MHMLKKKTLSSFWDIHPDAEQALKAWHAEAKNAHWKTPDDIKHRFRSADFLADNRVIFNIKGNDYRLVVKIHYNTGTIFIRFIGTHAEYDKTDVEKI